MRKALSMAAGAFSLMSEPKMLLISRLKLMSPRLSVTGSIRSSTRRTSRLQTNVHMSLNGRVAQVPGGDRQLDRGADQDPDRVGVDLVRRRGTAAPAAISTTMIATFQKNGEIANAPKRS